MGQGQYPIGAFGSAINLMMGTEAHPSFSSAARRDTQIPRFF